MIKRPWPSSMRTLANDHDRFQKTYFETYKGYYFTGDGCRRDKDGYYWLTGALAPSCLLPFATHKMHQTLKQEIRGLEAVPASIAELTR